MINIRTLYDELTLVVGKKNVLTDERRTLRFRRGFRAPPGPAIAVVRPGSLVELWRVLQICNRDDIAILLQAANTGLTGGSTPAPGAVRPFVVIHTMRLDTFHIVEGGRQIVCLPGVSLDRLECALRTIGREPHSVIGSSCFGASVIGGVCNNSGGSLLRRGPAYTELSLFAQVRADGSLHLVNHLGIDLGNEPEDMLRRLETGDFEARPTSLAASDKNYARHVRDIASSSPARFNCDPRRLHEASGSAGKIAVFAVRLDTFPGDDEKTTFYIGTNDREQFTRLRRGMLRDLDQLPISAEYIHRDAFDIADRYGRDIYYAIRLAGTARIPTLFAVKAFLDAVTGSIGIRHASDRLLQGIGRMLPRRLPSRMLMWRDRYEHHLILVASKDMLPQVQSLLDSLLHSGRSGYFLCGAEEAAAASLHRFVTAGAAMRFAAVEPAQVGDIVALDVALPRNADDWFGALHDEQEAAVAVVLRYGHFFCHVFHRDYLIRPGRDAAAFKQALLQQLDEQGAEYPAEHNVGRHYVAKPDLADFYAMLDPLNRFNPGIGKPYAGAAAPLVEP